MNLFEAQSIEIRAPFAKTFNYIAETKYLPRWTEAFASVSDGRAWLATPNGRVQIGLCAHEIREAGTVDWEMRFPDGNVAWAYSRVIKLGDDRSIYSFTLMPPPVPLAQLEGALEQQSQTLRKELKKLQEILAG